MAFVNPNDGSPVTLSPEQIQPAFTQGQIGATESVDLLDPNGQTVVTIPAENVQKAFEQGYTPISPKLAADSKAEAALQEKYSSVGQQVGAFGEGALKGATFGLGPAIEHHLAGVNPEDIANRAKYNPGLSTGGELAGIAGTAFIPGGAEAEAASLAPKLSFAGKIAKSALEGAKINAAYSIGDSISEADLGDPELTASQALSHATQAAVLGALGGGVLGLAERTISPVLNKASETFAGFSDKAKIAADKAMNAPDQAVVRSNAARELTNTLQEAADQDHKLTSEFFDKIRPAEKASNLTTQKIEVAQDAYKNWRDHADLYFNEAIKNPQTYDTALTSKLVQGVSALDKTVGAAKSGIEINKAMDEFKSNYLDKYLKIGGTPSNLEKDTINYFKPLRAELRSNLENPFFWRAEGEAQAAVNKAYNAKATAESNLNKLLGMKEEQITGSKPYKYQINKVNNYLHNAGLGDATVRADKLNNALDALHNARMNWLDVVSKSSGRAGLEKVDTSELTNLFDKINSQRVGGALANAPTEVVQKNTTIPQMVGQAGGILGSKVLGTVAPGLGHVVGYQGGVQAGKMLGEALVNGAGLTGRHQQILSKLASIASDSSKVLENGINTFMSKGGVAKTIAGVHATLRQPLEAGRSDLLGQRGKGNTEKRMAEITSLASSPNALVDHLSKKTELIAEAAPTVAFHVQSTVARGVGYLNTLIPASFKEQPMLSEDTPVLSPTQKDAFENAYGIVNEPIKTTINAMREGTLDKNQVEALANVHPSLYNQFVSTIMSKLVENPGKKLSIKHQQMLSILIGKGIGPSYGPDFTQFVQKVYGPQSAGGAGPANNAPKRGRPSKINVVQDELTPFQRSEQRNKES